MSAGVRPTRVLTRNRRAGRLLGECPVCRSAELEYEFIVDGYPACSCAKCSLLFLNPQPLVEGDTQRSADGGVYEINAANATSRLDLLTRYAEAPIRRLLLVGADPATQAEAVRRGMAPVAMTVPQLEQGHTPPGTGTGAMDAALVSCALETAADLDGALAELRRLLVPNGALMIVAPTIDSRTARLFRLHWWEFSHRNHFYFSTDTLQCLLSRTSFSDPIFMREASIVSLRYMKQKLATLRALRFRLLGILLGLSPPFFRNRLFRFLHSRTVALTRVTAPPSRRPLLSVVVPVYNEQATFIPLMDQLLEKTIEGVDIEVIIVESNSQDGTREQVLGYQAHPRVRVVLEDRPQGKGHAVRRGLELATGDIVLIQDADLEYDIGDYDALLEPIIRFERNFVIGSRHTPKGKFWKMREFNDAAGLAVFFNFGHLLFLTLFNLLYQQRLKDPFSMFKVFRRECLYGLDFECKRFDFDFELTIKLLRKGYSALELPVNYRARSFAAGKKVSIWRDPLTWIRALAKFRTSPLYERLERR